MATEMQSRPESPGMRIQTELARRGWKQDDLAKILGRPRTGVVNLIKGRSKLTADLAVGLAAVFGETPEEWLAMEAAWQLQHVREDIEAVARRRRLFELAPIKDMQRRGWIPETNNALDLERELCRFFGIENLDVDPQLGVAPRKRGDAPMSPQQRAWAFRAREIARALPTRPFEESLVRPLTKRLRELAAYPDEVRHVPRVLSEHGIRFVVVEALPGGSIDGAAMWLDEHSPVIAMSMRFDRVDWFWFTLCHEVIHIINRDALSIDDQLVGPDRRHDELDESERLANEGAATMLIDRAALESFIRRVGPLYSKPRIVQFAHRVQVHPGIIVGQLHHRGEVKPFAHREMLVKIRERVLNTSVVDGWDRSIGTI